MADFGQIGQHNLDVLQDWDEDISAPGSYIHGVRDVSLNLMEN